MKELPVGKTMTFKCVEGFNCDKCVFQNLETEKCSGFCGGLMRSDHKNVHFEEVENPDFDPEAVEWKGYKRGIKETLEKISDLVKKGGWRQTILSELTSGSWQ